MIPINKPWIGKEEQDEVMHVLEENALTSAVKDGGKRVRDFESLLRNYLKVKHTIAVNSGTASLYAALLAAGIKQGDEILLPSFTFVATANSIVAVGAKPVFVDIKPDDYTIDVSDLKAKITTKSKAIIPVHLYGHPSDMDEINELAEKYSLDVIEDACQSLGSTYNKKQTGTIGIMGCFSMYASKVLTCGEGGAIATNNDGLADKLKLIRNHGMVEGYDTRILGLNLRLPELSAAIAKVQMNKLSKMLELRRKNAELLTKLVFPTIRVNDSGNDNNGGGDSSKFGNNNDKKGIIRIPQETSKKKFNWYLYTVAFEESNLRDKIKERMISDKIGVTIYYDPPVHETPYYKDTDKLAITEWASKHVLSLPIHPLVTDQDIVYMAESIKKTYHHIL
jgi:dTDP-4-amino-4,6-dideoxygalactose transaminase